MKKSRKIVSIVAISLAIISIALFGLLPSMCNWLKLEPNFGEKVPFVNMVTNYIKDLQNFNLNLNFSSFMTSDWLKLSFEFIILIAILFDIVWIVYIVIKKKPLEIIWMILILITIFIAISSLSIQCLPHFEMSEAGLGKFDYILSSNPETQNDWLFIMIVSESLKEGSCLAEPLNKTSAIIELVAISLAVISVVAALASLVMSVVITFNSKEPRKDNNLFESEIEKGNKATLVRRILVRRNGDVEKVLDENYNDITNKKVKNNKTEKDHYQEILSK